VASTGNAGGSKITLLPLPSIFKGVEGWMVCKLSSVKVFVTLAPQ
jgi:hypothetical protein